jgi:hypothetical protein
MRKDPISGKSRKEDKRIPTVIGKRIIISKKIN